MEAIMEFLAAVKDAYMKLEGEDAALTTIQEMLETLSPEEFLVIRNELLAAKVIITDPPDHRDITGKTLQETIDKVLIPNILEMLIMEDPEVDAHEAKLLLR